MSKKQQIFKELKTRYNMLQSQGYEVVFMSLQGSQNYNMDIYTEEYKSDIDCFACIIPSFDDFIQNKSPISTTIVLDNNEHIGLKDIRLMFELFRKQNQQYLELLYTDYKIINKTYKDLLEPLFFNNEWVSQINKKSLYNAIAGAAMNKKIALEHPYPTIKWKIDKWGYDGKQLHHIIRLSQFIHNLENGMSFKKSLTYFEELVEMLAMNAKKNKLPLDEARFYASSIMDKIDEVKDKYRNTSIKDNEEYVDKLNNIKTDIIKRYYSNLLTPKQEKPFELNLDRYENVYVISDTHFGHTNILGFEQNRWKLIGSNEQTSIYRTIKMMNLSEEEINSLNIDSNEKWDEIKKQCYKEYIKIHDKKLIDNWNNTVSDKDLVLILGDFSFHKGIETNNILKQLNGDKVLIEGNHDMIYLQDKKFDKSLFKAIYDYKEVRYKDKTVILCHYPIMYFKHYEKENIPTVHLFGHIHSTPHIIPRRSYNVGVDVNNYEPINIEVAIKNCLNNLGGCINGQITNY